MKKIFITILLLTSCNKNYDTIYYTKSVKKSIHNLNVMENWIKKDYENGDLPEWIANNYLLNVEYTRISLEKNYEKNKKND